MVHLLVLLIVDWWSKGYLTSHKSIAYQSLREKHNQTSYGGKIHQLAYVGEKLKNGNDDNFHHWHSSTGTQKQAHYILNLQDNGQLRNDFRWMK